MKRSRNCGSGSPRHSGRSAGHCVTLEEIRPPLPLADLSPWGVVLLHLLLPQVSTVRNLRCPRQSVAPSTRATSAESQPREGKALCVRLRVKRLSCLLLIVTTIDEVSCEHPHAHY